MSEESAFLNAIRANIDDDLPRLVYADWLEERGHAARAEFIRVQCELARTPEWEPRYRILEDREHELLSLHEAEFLGPNWPEPRFWHQAPSEWIWRRGFVDEISINFGDLQDAGYLSDHPIRQLHCSSEFGQPVELLQCRDLWPMLEGLRGIDFAGWQNLEHDLLQRFFNSDRLPRLDDLDLSTVTHHWDACEILRQCPELCGRLRRLATSGQTRHSTRGSPLSRPQQHHRHAMQAETAVIALLQNGLEELIQIDFADDLDQPLTNWLRPGRPDRLVKLDLENNRRIKSLPDLKRDHDLPPVMELALDYSEMLEDRGPLDFIQNPAFRQLKALRLRGVRMDSRVVERLRSSHFWNSSLTRIGLNHVYFTDELLDPEGLVTPLRQLDLSGSRLNDLSIQRLSDGPLVEQLTHLHLDDCGLTDLGLISIINANSWTSLRNLTLSRNGFTEPLLRRLASSAAMPNLRQISLSHGNACEMALSRLVDNHDLTGCFLSSTQDLGSFLEELAQSPKLRRFNLLNFSCSPEWVQEEALMSLAESPYLSPICEVSLEQSSCSPRVLEAFTERLGRRFSI